MMRRSQSSRTQRTSDSQSFSEKASPPATPRSPAASAPTNAAADSDSDESSDGEGDAILRQYLMVLSHKELEQVDLRSSDFLFIYTVCIVKFSFVPTLHSYCECVSAGTRNRSSSRAHCEQCIGIGIDLEFERQSYSKIGTSRSAAGAVVRIDWLWLGVSSS